MRSEHVLQRRARAPGRQPPFCRPEKLFGLNFCGRVTPPPTLYSKQFGAVCIVSLSVRICMYFYGFVCICGETQCHIMSCSLHVFIEHRHDVFIFFMRFHETSTVFNNIHVLYGNLMRTSSNFSLTVHHQLVMVRVRKGWSRMPYVYRCIAS